MSTPYSREYRCILALKALKALNELENLKEAEEADKKRKHKFWVNPFLEKRNIDDHELEAHLLKDVLLENGKDCNNFCGITIHTFDEIHSMVELQIKKKHTVMRYAITSRVRLALALRYITTGASYRSLEFVSHVSRKTISKIVPDVLNAIVDALQSDYLKTPSSENEWLSVANDFDSFWQFPHTLGSLDGKHIRINAPQHAGSDYCNVKGFFSIVLLAVVDAHSRFIYINVCGSGRASDCKAFQSGSLYQSLISGELNIPPEERLKGQEVGTPFYFIGENIFGLDRHFLEAYNKNSKLNSLQEVFNYRLSRAQLTSEVAFGRLASRFKIFHRPIEIALNSCEILVKSCCVLHNYLSSELQTTDNEELENYIISLPETITPLYRPDHQIKYDCEIRDNVCSYCVTDGDIPLQWINIKNQTNLRNNEET